VNFIYHVRVELTVAGMVVSVGVCVTHRHADGMATLPVSELAGVHQCLVLVSHCRDPTQTLSGLLIYSAAYSGRHSETAVCNSFQFSQ
jgi:hypothetical protein